MSMSSRASLRTFLLATAVFGMTVAGQPVVAQQAGQTGRGGGATTPIDEARARQLYVSNKFEDHAKPNFQAAIDAKAKEDARYTAACAGALECTKIMYRSSVGDMDIPAYLFQPLKKRGARGHAAMIWVHGGVHGNWSISYFPFVKEAVERGYVVIAPEYRGSTGYGEAHHMAIDYGDKEVADVVSAYDYLKTLSHVDPDRVGMMGWSHGGYITLLSLFRDAHPFKAGAAIVPVTNLVFRLSYKGPGTSASSRRSSTSWACRSRSASSISRVRRCTTWTS